MPEQLAEILEGLGRPRVLVVGDVILDRYVWGEVERISPEAPIPVLSVTKEESSLGGAASVVQDLVALGVDVECAGVVGRDAAAAEFRALLRKAGVRDSLIVACPGRRTTTKARVIARKQQVLRVDREDTHELPAKVVAKVLAFVLKEIRRSQAVIVSDYGKGLVTGALVAKIAAAAKRAGIPVIADTAKQANFRKYRGLTAITPNRSESELATGMKIATVEGAKPAAKKLLRELKLDAVLMTLDRDGIVVMEKSGGFTHVPTRPRTVYDVTGAGDMVIAMVGAVVAAGHGWVDAARLANVAAGIEVQRIGCQPIPREDILRALAGEHVVAADKLKTPRELVQVLAEHRRRGDRIVFTNGCFDLLHVGHAKYIGFARRLGDLLVVGLNTDRSVRALKGPSRPVVGERERAQMLAALGDISYVVLFDDDTPEKLIRSVRPDVLVKGEDWKHKGVVGREFVESYGGEVILAPLVKGKSTTALIRRAQGICDTSSAIGLTDKK